MISVREISSDAAILPDVLNLLRRSFAYMEDRIDPPSSLHRLTLADIRETAQQGGLVGAFDGEELVGCVFLKRAGEALYVGKLAVDPGRQGHGIGRALILEAERRAADQNFPKVTLQTRIELTEIHQAFARMGFVKTSETAHDGYDRPTSITMTKIL